MRYIHFTYKEKYNAKSQKRIDWKWRLKSSRFWTMLSQIVDVKCWANKINKNIIGYYDKNIIKLV